MILKLVRELYAQTPNGVVRRDVAILYDDVGQRFGIKFVKALHPDLASGVFWLGQEDLLDIKRSGEMRYKKITIQLPLGDGVRDMLVQYDDARGMWGFRILNVQNQELRNATFWIKETDLVDVKQQGLASVAL